MLPPSPQPRGRLRNAHALVVLCLLAAVFGAAPARATTVDDGNDQPSDQAPGAFWQQPPDQPHAMRLLVGHFVVLGVIAGENGDDASLPEVDCARAKASFGQLLGEPAAVHASFFGLPFHGPDGTVSGELTAGKKILADAAGDSAQEADGTLFLTAHTPAQKQYAVTGFDRSFLPAAFAVNVAGSDALVVYGRANVWSQQLADALIDTYAQLRGGEAIVRCPVDPGRSRPIANR